MLGSSFHNLVVAGMKHLEYWEVWNLIGEKNKTVNTQGNSHDSPGIEQVGKFRMERMQRVMKYLVKHTQWTNKTTVLQTNCKIWNLKFTSSWFLLRSLRWELAAEDQTGEQYSKQGKIKELKHLNNTLWSATILKDFLCRPIFWATKEE